MTDDERRLKRGKRAAFAGAFLGVIVGFVICAVGWAFLVLSVGLTLSANKPQGASQCAAASASGVGLALAAIGLAVLAWYMLVRVKRQSFGVQFLRGFAIIAAIFNLAPWPCSLTGAAYFAFTVCR